MVIHEIVETLNPKDYGRTQTCTAYRCAPLHEIKHLVNQPIMLCQTCFMPLWWVEGPPYSHRTGDGSILMAYHDTVADDEACALIKKLSRGAKL